MMKRRRFIYCLFLCTACLFVNPHCISVLDKEPTGERLTREIILAWNELFLELERYTPGYRVPVSARTHAYVATAVYEAALPGLKNCRSPRLVLKGAEGLKIPEWLAGVFVLPAAVNSAYADMARYFFPTAPAKWLEKVQGLENRYAKSVRRTPDLEAVEATEYFARQVAGAVWEWSKTDISGNNAWLFNYDKNYTPRTCPGCWEQRVPPLLPFWGNVRTFIVGVDSFGFKPPLSYDETPGSEYYKQALELYSMSQTLSKDMIWIAEFWSDDLEGLTMTPAGRWVSILDQIMEKEQSIPEKCLQSYLLLSYALHDATVACWAGKYRYQLERPEHFINRIISNRWRPLHPSPNFPSYPSGHAMFGAAAAAVLARQFGDHYGMVDRTHQGRREFEGMPRRFSSFEEMAREAAFSRMAMGVHFRMDCEEGLRLGGEIGQKIAKTQLQTPREGF